jgi:energy-coupling factor transporter ATP-binding protein EcfA2
MVAAMNTQNLKNLVPTCHRDFVSAGLTVKPEFIRRVAASLLAKRFLILTGLSGSGKTKVAQSFARWLSPTISTQDPFKVGTQINDSYRVMDADRISVEFWNKYDEKVILPRRLISEWANFIDKNPAFAEMPSKEIRDKFKAEYDSVTGPKFASHAILWDSHLKPAALAMLKATQPANLGERLYEVVAVGADWTSNEQVLGYADGLNPNRYVRTKTLDLILRAIATPDLPHFLILDEMNLSHVERYFADLLSALESDEPIHLHSDRTADGGPAVRDGVPSEIKLPPNLFVIGTVNVDETTYMFSPKVLDRANVIEFRIAGGEMAGFLDEPKPILVSKLDGQGAAFGAAFVTRSGPGGSLEPKIRAILKAELMLFFDVLAGVQSEFGFRVAKEIAAFIETHRSLSGEDWDFRCAMDAQIVQKILPRLHGSRAKLEPVLSALAILCHRNRTWALDAEDGEFDHIKAVRIDAANAAKLDDESLDPLGTTPDGNAAFASEEAFYALSFEKLTRMLARLRTHGFVSFAEG